MTIQASTAFRIDPQDGTPLTLRPITPADRARLVAGFDRLSELSRYRRFMAPVR